jgi:predicted nucleic-acid-binding protein
MIAVDTNIVVRLVANDDPEQARRAARLFMMNVVFIPKTVILETEWVLRGAYRLDPAQVNATLRTFLSLERLVIEDEDVVMQALDSHAAGLDFADALHLFSSSRAERFYTYDVRLRTDAAKHFLYPPVAVP